FIKSFQDPSIGFELSVYPHIKSAAFFKKCLVMECTFAGGITEFFIGSAFYRFITYRTISFFHFLSKFLFISIIYDYSTAKGLFRFYFYTENLITMDRKYITLKNLMIEGQKCIGLKFYQDKVLQALVNELPGVDWSEEFHMNYVPNSPAALDGIFDQFRGVAWVNCNHFFTNSGFSRNNEDINVDWFRKRKHPAGYRRCPEDYLLKLELKRYANNTVKTYVSCFEAFINHYNHIEPENINENDIRAYLQKLIQEGSSNSYINQAINAIKFYYEVVMEMPNRFYGMERPRVEEKLPKVLSKEEVLSIIAHTNNIKHRCVISLLYSAGLRRNELLNLIPEDIDGKRMMIKVRGGKGNKDRF